jgi:hypothetical protein
VLGMMVNFTKNLTNKEIDAGCNILVFVHLSWFLVFLHNHDFAVCLAHFLLCQE